jgi:pentafunctional AROM polypeptide
MKVPNCGKKEEEKKNNEASANLLVTQHLMSNPWDVDEVPVGDTSVVCFKYTLDGTLCEELVKRVPAHIYCLVADENVFALFGEQFLAKFKATGKTLFHIVLPSGETTKDRRVKEQVEDFMLRNKMNRDTCCIALGGGVIGDLTGYIAATFMRGVPFVQLPTTLLAMVDASVGGKTAVNTAYGKNLIGAFHQPTVVFMDMGFLEGFSKRDPVRAEREFRAGIAEIIKTGAIWDASLFEVCEQRVEAIQARERGVLNEIVRRSVAIKAEVVSLDPKEAGLRAILNWGHTIGHGVEGLMGMTDYTDGLLHGECVAIGMVLESNLARAMGVLHSSAVGRIVRCIEAYKLPTKIPGHLRIDDIMKKMMGDKKNTGGKLKCVIIDRIGHCYEPKASMVDAELVRMVCSPNITPVPKGPLTGTVRVPGSKSVSNRVLPLAVMGTGRCCIRGLLHSDDTQRCMEALCLLHPDGEAAFEWEEGGAVLAIKGAGGKMRVPRSDLYLGNSGTSARFLTGVVTVLSEAGASVVVTGNKRMQQRPLKDMVDALRSLTAEGLIH